MRTAFRPRLTPALAAVAALALALALPPAAAGAQVTVYTSLATFLAATSGAGTDTYDDLAFGATGTSGVPLARTAGAFGYTAAASTTEFFVVGTGADRWLSPNTGTDVVTFAGFGPGVRGVGGLFFGTDLDGAFRAGTSLTFTVTDALGTTTRTLADATTTGFFGFVSGSRITQLTVAAVQPTAGTDVAFPTVNNFVLAGPAVNVIPEPSTVALVGAGLAAAAGWRRRGRRAAGARP